MEKQVKNYGVDLVKEVLDSSEEDHIFGAGSKSSIDESAEGLVLALYAWGGTKNGIYFRVANPINHCVCSYLEEFKDYYPNGELQFGKEDYMDCVARGFINEIERRLNCLIDLQVLSPATIKWLQNNQYLVDNRVVLSNRIPAIGSGTTRNGNSLKAVVDWIRKNGIHPRAILPNESNLTWSQYHNGNDITQEMLDLGKESLNIITINYDKVFYSNFPKFFGNFKWYIFDNYIDRFDGDWVKRLAENYNFLSYGYRIIINEVKQKEATPPKEEKMKFYRATRNPNPDRIYQLGQDGLFHWITEAPVFIGLYGDFYNNEIEDLGLIPSEKIGFAVYNKQSIINKILELFINLKGKK